MANEEHLAILRQGVKVWNAWRKFYSGDRPDLRQSSLQGVDLRGVDLRGVDLRGVDLRGVDLHRAKLERAALQWADLRKADLYETNLTQAKIGGSIFDMVDLRTVRGLDTIYHNGPSTVGIDTLYRSKGRIPESFLRGCGVPDFMIAYARVLVTAELPIDYYSCFITYSSADEAFVVRLHTDLQAAGVRCWLRPGETTIQGSDEVIRFHDKVLLVLSESSVCSSWIEQEVKRVLTWERTESSAVLLPVRIDDMVFATQATWAGLIHSNHHIRDFRAWKGHDAYQQTFARLLHDLRTE